MPAGARARGALRLGPARRRAGPQATAARTAAATATPLPAAGVSARRARAPAGPTSATSSASTTGTVRGRFLWDMLRVRSLTGYCMLASSMSINGVSCGVASCLRRTSHSLHAYMYTSLAKRMTNASVQAACASFIACHQLSVIASLQLGCRLVLPAVCGCGARPGARRHRVARGDRRRRLAGVPGDRAAGGRAVGEPELWVRPLSLLLRLLEGGSWYHCLTHLSIVVAAILVPMMIGTFCPCQRRISIAVILLASAL